MSEYHGVVQFLTAPGAFYVPDGVDFAIFYETLNSFTEDEEITDKIVGFEILDIENVEESDIPDIPALMASGELSLENSLTFLTTAANLPPELITAVTQLDGIQTVRYGFTAVPNELATLTGAPGVFGPRDLPP